MDPSFKIDWDDERSLVLSNPKLAKDQTQKLEQLAEKFPQRGHIWVASSGSSAANDQSVKLIALSKEAFLTSATAVNLHLESTKEDIWVQALPRFHVGGLSIEARAAVSGARIVEGMNFDKWNPDFFFRALNENRGTLSALVPTQVFDLIQKGYRAPSSLRAIVIGGSAMSSELLDQAIDLGWPLLPSYGLTECCSQVATAELKRWNEKKPQLKLLSHIQARMNTQGLLQIQSGALLTGYAQWLGDEAQWRDPKDHEGWFQTEDLCEIHGDILRPLGRGSDYVKISGEGVNLRNLQEKLENLLHKEFSQAWQSVALAALEDRRTGSAIVLVATHQISETLVTEIQKKFNAAVAPFERVKRVARVGEIPRTALGKISREKLKKLLGSEPT